MLSRAKLDAASREPRRQRAGAYTPYVQYNVPPARSAHRYATSIRRVSGGDGSAAAAEREERIGAVVGRLLFHTDYYAPIAREGAFRAVNAAAIPEFDSDAEDEAADGHADTRDEDASADGYRAVKQLVAGTHTLTRELELRRARGAMGTAVKMVDAHLHVLSGLSAMQAGDAQVIHFDLKSDRLMYDAARGLPKITGFGVAFRRSDVDPGDAASLRTYFYAYADEYAPWCIDVALLAYIATHALAPGENARGVDDAISEDDAQELRDVCRRFAQNNRMFAEGHYTPAQTEAFVAATETYAAGLRGQTWRAAATDLLDGWRTWDVYALCVIYRRALGSLFGDTFAESGATSPQKSSSFWVSGYVALLEGALLAPPAAQGGARRASPEEMAAAVSAGATSLAASDAVLDR